jgi:hypothetical protein
VDRNATKNGLSVGGRNRLRHAAPPQPGRPKDAGKDLVEQFLAELDRSFQEHGHEIFHIVMTTQPKLYFRALVMLAVVQQRGSSKLSDLDRQRNRAEALLRLEQRAKPTA